MTTPAPGYVAIAESLLEAAWATGAFKTKYIGQPIATEELPLVFVTYETTPTYRQGVFDIDKPHFRVTVAVAYQDNPAAERELLGVLDAMRDFLSPTMNDANGQRRARLFGNANMASIVNITSGDISGYMKIAGIDVRAAEYEIEVTTKRSQ